MKDPSRRKLITSIGALSISSISGCMGGNINIPFVGGNLKENWRSNDDFPNDEFRNYASIPPENPDNPTTDSASSARQFPSDITGGTSLTSGYTTGTTYLTPIDTVDHTVMSSEVHFECEIPLDVYVTNKKKAFPDMEYFSREDDLSKIEYIEEHSEFGVSEYHNLFESTSEKEYYFIITPEGYRVPKETPEEMVDRVENEWGEISIDGWQIIAYYVPFENYKNSESTRRSYNFEREDTNLGV